MGKRNNLSVIELTQTEFTDLKAGSRLDRGSIYLVDGKFYSSLGDEIIAGAAAVAAASGIYPLQKTGSVRTASVGDSLFNNGFVTLSGSAGQTVVVSGGVATIDLTASYNYSPGMMVQVLIPPSLRSGSNYNYVTPIIAANSDTQITVAMNGLADGTYTIGGQSWSIILLSAVTTRNIQVWRNMFKGRNAMIVASYAIGGTTSGEILNALPNLLAGPAWDECDICTGTNDIISSSAANVKAAVDSCIANIQLFITQAKVKGGRFRYWIPSGTDAAKYGSYATWMTRGFAYLRKQAFLLQLANPSLELVDMQAAMVDSGGVLDTNITDDGIHPNGYGAVQLGRIAAAQSKTLADSLIVSPRLLSSLDDGTMAGDPLPNILANGLLTGSSACNGAGDGVHGIVAGSTQPTGWSVPWMTTSISATFTANQAIVLPSGEISNRDAVGKRWRMQATTTAQTNLQTLSSQSLNTSMVAGQYYRLRFNLDILADSTGLRGIVPFLFLTGGKSIYLMRDLDGGSEPALAKFKAGDLVQYVTQPFKLSSIPASVQLYIWFALASGANVDMAMSAVSMIAEPAPW